MGRVAGRQLVQHRGAVLGPGGGDQLGQKRRERAARRAKKQCQALWRADRGGAGGTGVQGAAVGLRGDGQFRARPAGGRGIDHHRTAAAGLRQQGVAGSCEAGHRVIDETEGDQRGGEIRQRGGGQDGHQRQLEGADPARRATDHAKAQRQGESGDQQGQGGRRFGRQQQPEREARKDKVRGGEPGQTGQRGQAGQVHPAPEERQLRKEEQHRGQPGGAKRKGQQGQSGQAQQHRGGQGQRQQAPDREEGDGDKTRHPDQGGSADVGHQPPAQRRADEGAEAGGLAHRDRGHARASCRALGHLGAEMAVRDDVVLADGGKADKCGCQRRDPAPAFDGADGHGDLGPVQRPDFDGQQGGEGQPPAKGKTAPDGIRHPFVL